MVDIYLHRDSQTNAIFAVRIDETRITALANPIQTGLAVPFEVLEYAGDAAWKSNSRGILSLGGRLSLRSENVPAGIVIPQQLFAEGARTLIIPLNLEQAEVIDAQRDQGTFTLYLWLDAIGALKSAQKSVARRELAVLTSGQPPAYLRIEREQWLTILADLGGEQRRLVELPFADYRNETSAWKECSSRLQDATRQWRRREYRDAASSARVAIEGLTTILGTHYGIKREDRKNMEEWALAIGNILDRRWTDASGEPSSDGKLLTTLIFAAYSWTSPSHHFGGFAFDRRSAALAISIATDLYLFIAGLI
jgi:hypothetical protein